MAKVEGCECHFLFSLFLFFFINAGMPSSANDTVKHPFPQLKKSSNFIVDEMERSFSDCPICGLAVMYPVLEPFYFTKFLTEFVMN